MPNTLPLGSNHFLKINPLCILSKLQSAQSYTAEELEDMSIQILKLQDHISLFEEVALQLRDEADDLPADDEELREIYNDQITALSQTVEAMTGYAKVCRDEILKRKAAGAGVEESTLSPKQSSRLWLTVSITLIHSLSLKFNGPRKKPLSRGAQTLPVSMMFGMSRRGLSAH